mmetsp:Transcript_120181/g.285563  ORF Transcript_120181/g.285563 Transcript_120181/m.285563 type:complete len:85 (-) Transcript_120181:51-305(-)
MDIWEHPRHGGVQDMILKERKWAAKAIERFREHRPAVIQEVKPQPRPEGEIDNASLLKFGKGCLLTNNIRAGPSAYYTGCGRRR